jgi:hypothetical protein
LTTPTLGRDAQPLCQLVGIINNTCCGYSAAFIDSSLSLCVFIQKAGIAGLDIYMRRDGARLTGIVFVSQVFLPEYAVEGELNRGD